jgi:glutaminyl-tRNA synthetase
LLAQPRPHQYEFARLNITYIVTSKRKLKQLVDEGHVQGWDDPRMPTLVGMRRRGYTAAGLQLLAERSGVSKAGGWLDYSSIDIALRDDLDPNYPYSTGGGTWWGSTLDQNFNLLKTLN